MENVFEITIDQEQDSQSFEVTQFVSDEGTDSRFDLFQKGHLVLTVEPDGDNMRTMKNPGELDEEIIHLIIDKIDAHYL